ncbi:MAG TPA: nitrate- and nitrite sensing domain-containing protein, partial [Micromonosporaceae bacterium]|nr:nitrate- and nitrite sensing domain-containing protein [Micromonosporaceae bacterium]
MSRLRRPMGRLRDTPIWAKLGLIMIVPTIATVIVGTNGLVTHIRTQSEAERARDLATLSQAAGDLVHNLQNENATAVMLLATPPSDQHKQAYAAAQEAVEEAKRPYSQQRNTINGVPDTFDRLLGEIDKGLADVPGWRSKVQNDDFTLSETIRAYQALIDGLIAIRDSATQLAGDNVLGERERVAAEVARIKDFMAQRRVVILEMFSRDAF